MAPIRSRPRNVTNNSGVAVSDAAAVSVASTSHSPTNSEDSIMGEMLNVVTSVTQGMGIEGESQMLEIFPNISIDFIKVAAEAQAEAHAAQRMGPVTRGRVEPASASKRFLEMLPDQLGIDQADAETTKALEIPSGPRQALADRRRQAQMEAILRLGNPFSYKFCIPDIKPEILNVVASANLVMRLDLKKIGQRCDNVEYNPSRFAPCVMRIREPRCTALIFGTGRMIVSGCKTEADSKTALHKFARHIRVRLELDPITFYLLHYEVQNISANISLKWPINLQQMAEDPKAKEFISYEAELFPGLVFTLIRPKCKIVIFATGALLMTGLTSEAEVQIALEMIFPICRRFRR